MAKPSKAMQKFLATPKRPGGRPRLMDTFPEQVRADIDAAIDALIDNPKAMTWGHLQEFLKAEYSIEISDGTLQQHKARRIAERGMHGKEAVKGVRAVRG